MKLIDPIIPIRKNPILSTPENSVYEDDHRTFLPPPEGSDELKIGVDFFDPNSDCYYEFVRNNYVEKHGVFPWVDQFYNPMPTVKVQDEQKHIADIPSQVTIQTQQLEIQPDSPPKIHAYKRIPQRQGREHLKPIDTVEYLIRHYHFRVFEKSLYFYDRFCYRYCCKDDFKVLCVSLCEDDVAEAGCEEYVEKVYNLLTIMPQIQIKDEDIPRDIISFRNTLFNVSSFKTISPTPFIFTTFAIECSYPTVILPCPHFDKFLMDVSGGNQYLIQRIWEFFGYCLSPDTNAKKIFVLQGIGDSGKSLLSNILASFFPRHLRTSMDIHELDSAFGLSELIGKYLCISGDLSAQPLKGNTVSQLKKCSGNDPMNANRKYQSRAEFICRARFILASNHPIRLEYSDAAFAKRLVVMPFYNTIPMEKQDPFLLEKIKTEKDAIAIRALCYYQRLVQNKYRFAGDFHVNEYVQPCASVEQEAMLDLDSEIKDFLLSNVIKKTDGYVHLYKLHRLFKQQFHDISQNQFSSLCFRAVADTFPNVKHLKRRSEEFSSPCSGFLGIELKNGEVEK